jgi:hypothetical protein
MMIPLVAAGGFLLLDAPQASAHQEVRSLHHPSAHYRVDHRRTNTMPRWLKRNKPFVRWYRHSDVRYDRWLSWNELFRIFRWQRAGITRYYPGAPYYGRHHRHRVYGDVHRNPRATRRPHRH